MTRDEHQSMRESLGAYVLGQLDEEEAARARQHLAECADCRAEHDEIAALRPLLEQASPPQPAPTPPPDLEQRILHRVRAEDPAQPTTGPAQPSSGPMRPSSGPVRPSSGPMRDARPERRRGQLLVAAAVAAILGGGAGYLLAPGPPAVPTEVVAVQEVGQGVEASAVLVPHTWGMEIKLTGRGFESGAVYQVNVVGADGSSSAAGEFIGTGPNEMLCNLNSGVLRADAAGFEVTDPSGRIVVSSSF